jgi:4-hydroxy-3-polyprenylbenzoate decarboxylase/2,5-furandicarboxylate decarboxylase 1
VAIVVDPDIDVSSSEVEWALAFRVQPQRDVIIVDQIPAGPSDPSIDGYPTTPRPFRTASAIGVDATRPFGKPFSEVADVPGWETFEVPELDRRP